MAEGLEVFRELKAALDRAKADLGECQQESDRLGVQTQDLLARRGEALLKLAGHYLPEVSRTAIEATFEGIRDDLLAILARREAKRTDLRSKLEQGSADLIRLNARADDVTKRLNEKVAVRERLEAQVAETLKGHADFQERSKIALEAETKLHRDERRVEEISRESREKLPQYDRSRLFRYLYDRGYDTSDYHPRNWVRSLDRRVADLIDYPMARNGYEFLKKTPELVAAEVSRRRDRFAELMGQVEAIAKLEADKVGLTAVLTEGDTLGLERDGLVQEVGKLQKSIGAVQRDLAGLDLAQGEFHRQAIERFRTFLGETKLAVLQRRARQTPEAEDDAIVAEVAGLDDQIGAMERQSAGLADRRKAADRMQEGLDRVVRKFRQANFDSDRSTFESFDPRSQIARFAKGTTSGDDLWRSLQSAQKFRPSWVQETASNGLQVAASPAGRVILGALVDIAGAAMRESAYRGVQRRTESSFPTFPNFPSSGGGGWSQSPPFSPSNSNSNSEGGFTSGEGF